MPRFRRSTQPIRHPEQPAGPLALDQVRRLAADALQPAHFFTGQGISLQGVYQPTDEIPWEIFHGRLLDRAHTTQSATFESWNLFLTDETGRSAEPLLSLKLDASAEQLHVTRAIYCYAWEAFDQGGNVILSRETKKWLQELVGTIFLARFTDEDNLRDEIICRIFQAVVGTSRLPLTSVESPLPVFSLGRLTYCYRPGLSRSEAASGPVRTYQELVQRMGIPELARVEQAKLLETILHAVPSDETDKATDLLLTRRATFGEDVIGLFQTLFNEVSLSPYTDLVDKALAVLKALPDRIDQGRVQVADFLSRLLRQLGRHLTAYDLVTFHHRGANYPDALLLDAALKMYLDLAERFPALFMDATGDAEGDRLARRLRRRALRQGWMLRRRYEGHLVPDAPTSQGENMRVLPPPHVRVPEEQILNPHRRRRLLNEGDPLDKYLGEQARAILRQSIHDLRQPHELRELGMAIFLDRPLGVGKDPLEPDQTPLFSYEAFSRSIAANRLRLLADKLGLIPDPADLEALHRTLDAGLEVRGIPAEVAAGRTHPGAVSLADALRVADDFLVLRATAQPLRDFMLHYRWEPLRELGFPDRELPSLLLRTSSAGQGLGVLTLYDRQLRKRLEFDFDPRAGYEPRGGVEYPLSPLRVLRLWEQTDTSSSLREHDLRDRPISLTPLSESAALSPL